MQAKRHIAERIGGTRVTEASVGVALLTPPTVVDVKPMHAALPDDPPPVAREKVRERDRVGAARDPDEDIRI